LELIGSRSPTADAEIIEITVKFYTTIGIRGVCVLLNSIGRFETRRRYAEAILKYAEPFLKGMPTDIQQRAYKNPLRLLDSKDPELIEALREAPYILDFLEEDSKKHFEQLQELLTEAGVSYTVDPRIVRGLDYYTDTVFEVQSPLLGAQSSLCGGGRYDMLVEQLGGPPTPCVGVALGMERALLVEPKVIMEAPQPRLDVYVVAVGEEAQKETRNLARQLREAGLSANYDLDFKSLKAQLKNADRMQARFAALLGENELAQNAAALRNLETGQQELVSLPEVASWVEQRLQEKTV
jgi:histidyl-tRNA synthetase